MEVFGGCNVISLFFAAPEPSGTAPDFTEALPEELNVTMGEKVVLQAKVSGVPEPKVEWLFDDSVIEESPRYVTSYDGSCASLTIEAVSKDDDALITCTAENEHGLSECSCDLLVAEAVDRPVFLEMMKPVSSFIDSEAKFTVVLENDELVEVKWFLNEKQVKDRGRHRLIKEKDGQFVFIIENCKLTDRGVVKCIALNEGGETSCTAELMIAEENSAPGLKQVSDSVGEFLSGEDARLEVLISGIPVPTVDWLKGFKKISENQEKFQIESSDTKNVLVIKDLKLEDSGSYKCIVSNASGENSVTFTLKVKGESLSRFFSARLRSCFFDLAARLLSCLFDLFAHVRSCFLFRKLNL